VRCPKCHYLSFEPEPRCKNCGYDLTFGSADLPFAQTEEEYVKQPDADLDLISRPAKRPPITGTVDLAPPPPVQSSVFDLPIRSADGAAVVAVSNPPEPEAPAASDTAHVVRRTASPPPTTTELPLFVRAAPDAGARIEPAEGRDFDALLTKLRRGPRAPLSVRKTTPSATKLREQYGRQSPPERQVGLLDREVLEPAREEVREAAPDVVPVEAIAPPETKPIVSDESATATRRLEAAIVDGLVLGGIDVGIVWLTLQMCGLTFSQVNVLPILPLAAFLFLLNCGYLLMFTAASGQTIGKMAAGIRVVSSPDEISAALGTSPADFDPRLTLGQVFVRSVTTFVSILTFGAAFVPALLGSRRALHDRFAHTRVVRA